MALGVNWLIGRGVFEGHKKQFIEKFHDELGRGEDGRGSTRKGAINDTTQFNDHYREVQLPTASLAGAHGGLFLHQGAAGGSGGDGTFFTSPYEVLLLASSNGLVHPAPAIVEPYNNTNKTRLLPSRSGGGGANLSYPLDSGSYNYNDRRLFFLALGSLMSVFFIRRYRPGVTSAMLNKTAAPNAARAIGRQRIKQMFQRQPGVPEASGEAIISGPGNHYTQYGVALVGGLYTFSYKSIIVGNAVLAHQVGSLAAAILVLGSLARFGLEFPFYYQSSILGHIHRVYGSTGRGTGGTSLCGGAARSNAAEGRAGNMPPPEGILPSDNVLGASPLSVLFYTDQEAEADLRRQLKQSRSRRIITKEDIRQHREKLNRIALENGGRRPESSDSSASPEPMTSAGHHIERTCSSGAYQGGHDDGRQTAENNASRQGEAGQLSRSNGGAGAGRWAEGRGERASYAVQSTSPYASSEDGRNSSPSLGRDGFDLMRRGSLYLYASLVFYPSKRFLLWVSVTAAYCRFNRMLLAVALFGFINLVIDYNRFLLWARYSPLLVELQGRQSTAAGCDVYKDTHSSDNLLLYYTNKGN